MKKNPLAPIKKPVKINDECAALNHPSHLIIALFATRKTKRDDSTVSGLIIARLIARPDCEFIIYDLKLPCE